MLDIAVQATLAASCDSTTGSQRRSDCTVRKTLGLCLSCKHSNSSYSKQHMVDLPLSSGTSGNPTFYFTGIDNFGSITAIRGRSLVKRYGCMLTCLTMRTVHLKISLDFDAFINAVLRFISRGGKDFSVTIVQI